MNVVLWDNESVWCNNWPYNECRSQWPIFHGLMVLPYILKSIWLLNVIYLDNESVWCNNWPSNRCRSQWSIFHSPVILPNASLKSSDVCLLVFLWMQIMISFWLAKCDSGNLRCPASALIFFHSFLARLNNVHEALLYYCRRWHWCRFRHPQMFKFFGPHNMFLHVRSDDRYWSKILRHTIPTPVHDLSVKVTDLEFLYWCFAFKFLQCQILRSLWWFDSCLGWIDIWF